MQFTLDKISSLVHHQFTTCYLRKATNSAGPGVRLSATDSAQHVDQIRTLYERSLDES